jgi:CelD/BcsL family acetyltransferase involved in cellulose biosynthesis
MLTELRSNPRTPRRRPGESDRVRARARDHFDLFETSWPSDDSSSCQPSANIGWLRAAQAAYFESAEIQVFAAESQHRILAATALVGVRRGGILRQIPLGGEIVPVDVAVQDARGLRCLTDSLIRARQPLCLDRLPADSQTLPAIRHSGYGRAIVTQRAAAATQFVSLDESWIEPERHLAPIERRRLTRARKRAERIGPVTVEIHTPDLSELPRLLDAIDDLSASAETRLDEAQAARRLGQAVFFRQYAEAACVATSLRICMLRIGDHVAAAQVCVEGEHAAWMIIAESSPRFARCQPGQLLACEVLRYCAQANLSSLELWIEAQPWMQFWPLTARDHVSLRVYPISIRGTAALLFDSATAIYRRAKKVLRRS